MSAYRLPATVAIPFCLLWEFRVRPLALSFCVSLLSLGYSVLTVPTVPFVKQPQWLILGYALPNQRRGCFTVLRVVEKDRPSLSSVDRWDIAEAFPVYPLCKACINPAKEVKPRLTRASFLSECLTQWPRLSCHLSPVWHHN